MEDAAVGLRASGTSKSRSGKVVPEALKWHTQDKCDSATNVGIYLVIIKLILSVKGPRKIGYFRF
jgi:hypothetical protein